MSEPFLGEVKLVGWNFAARGWAFCDGQLLPISQNTALFSLLGTMYGGDGRTTFALPDLRGRAAIHKGRGPGLSDYRQGARGGVERVTLTQTEIPSHNHNARLQAENRPGTSDDPTNNMPAQLAGAYRSQARADDVPMNPAAVLSDNVGGSQSHENMQPFLVMNYIIALVGIFPSRS
jgi:microcystin-dependent protein